MRYRVVENFEIDSGKSDPSTYKTGAVFIPAETNVAANVVASLLSLGKIEIIRNSSKAKK